MQARRLVVRGRPPVSYDVLSIDIGIAPGTEQVAGACEFATGVKPIDRRVPGGA